MQLVTIGYDIELCPAPGSDIPILVASVPIPGQLKSVELSEEEIFPPATLFLRKLAGKFKELADYGFDDLVINSWGGLLRVDFGEGFDFEYEDEDVESDCIAFQDSP